MNLYLIVDSYFLSETSLKVQINYESMQFRLSLHVPDLGDEACISCQGWKGLGVFIDKSLFGPFFWVPLKQADSDSSSLEPHSFGSLYSFQI